LSLWEFEFDYLIKLSARIEMASNADRLVGGSMLLFSTALFIYYTFWVLLTPFIDADHFVQRYFPARHYAILIPAIAGVVAVSGVASFVALVMIRSGKSK
jgi:dolichyl-phosphate mannosyltransferase polypeptide 2 regulatory subunit